LIHASLTNPNLLIKSNPIQSRSRNANVFLTENNSSKDENINNDNLVDTISGFSTSETGETNITPIPTPPPPKRRPIRNKRNTRGRSIGQKTLTHKPKKPPADPTAYKQIMESLMENSFAEMNEAVRTNEKQKATTTIANVTNRIATKNEVRRQPPQQSLPQDLNKEKQLAYQRQLENTLPAILGSTLKTPIDFADNFALR